MTTDKKPDDRFPGLTAICLLIRDVGMPVVVLGVGVYGFLQIFSTKADSPLLIGAAFFLTAAGLGSQLWLHARENPPKRDDQPAEDATRMMRIAFDFARDMAAKRDKSSE